MKIDIYSETTKDNGKFLIYKYIYRITMTKSILSTERDQLKFKIDLKSN